MVSPHRTVGVRAWKAPAWKVPAWMAPVRTVWRKTRALAGWSLVLALLAGAATARVPGSGEPVPFARAAAAELKFSELYAGQSVRGLIFSDKVKSLAGQTVTMVGYMAPPVKPKFTFFVLTRVRLSVCPFCSSDADWPADIVLVLLPKGKETSPTASALRVTGRLEIGSQTDPETGFVSQVRILAERIEVL